MHSWPRTLTLELYEEPIRQFLAEETAEFPKEAAVIVIVGTDKLTGETWFLPTQCDDVWFHDVGFLALGVMFRVIPGRSPW